MANNQITPFQLTDQFTMDNFNQRINETNTALQKKADTTKKATVILSTNWTGDASPYTQTVTISGTTANSKVDLQPDATAIAQMADDGVVALYIANDNGTLTANAVGERPTVELTIQATITEVSAWVSLEILSWQEQAALRQVSS